MSAYVEPPTIPEDQTIAEYRRTRPQQRATRAAVVNACRQWTRMGHPIRHRRCRDLPITECEAT